MFNLADYLETILPEIPEAKKLYLVTDISKMEGMLNDMRNTPDCFLIVRETGDGYLNLKDRLLDSSFHNFFVFVRSKDSGDIARHEAKKKAMSIGMKIFKKMKTDSSDFGDPAYGTDFSKIDYMAWGPIGQGCHGYSFFLLVEQHV